MLGVRLSLSCLLVGVVLFDPGVARAAVATTPLPAFPDGAASVELGVYSGLVKRLRLQTLVMCTSLASSDVQVGVQVFDETGLLKNDVNAGVGVVSNVGPGATVTISTSATAAFLESATIPLADISQGALRVVASSPAVSCVVMVVDDAVSPPVNLGTLRPGVRPKAGSVLPGVALPTFSDSIQATHSMAVPGVIKRGRMETNVLCTSLAAGPIDLGVQFFGPAGVSRNDVGSGNGALLNVMPGTTVTFGSTGTAAYLESTVVVMSGVSQGLAQIVSTSADVVCSAQMIDSAVTPPVAMSILDIVVDVGAPVVPTATSTSTSTPTNTPTRTPTNTSTATATDTAAPMLCQLDVDASGSVLAATDGVYVFRFLQGLASVVPPSFRALDPSIPGDLVVGGNVDSMGVGLDVDGDGFVGAATDGVYIFRRLLGLQTVVPASFRVLLPGIPPDSVVGANVDALCIVN